jgi:linoleoyl-CoA desaturase
MLLQLGVDPVSFAIGTAALSAAKILENMEVGHNIMHGQYDWTKDPELDGRSYEWDHVCAGEDWRHSHNYEHHTFTNILGKDRDVGYGIVRIDPSQPWHIGALAQPLGPCSSRSASSGVSAATIYASTRRSRASSRGERSSDGRARS